MPPLQQRYEDSDSDSDDDSDGDEEVIVEDVESDDEETWQRMEGLRPPTLNTGEPVTGATKQRCRIKNKSRRKAKQAEQAEFSYWQNHVGQFQVPTTK